MFAATSGLRSARVVAACVALAACGGQEPQHVVIDAHHVALATPRIPHAPGENSPSLVTIDRHTPRRPNEVTEGTQLSDVDSCASCHPDAAAQWSRRAHSFASFGNPSYRVNVELARKELGKETSRHCAGCHDMPLAVDGLMTVDAPIPAADLRAHSGVTCSLCHGVKSVTKDGNGSYVWWDQMIGAPG